ncbi:MAG TPA: ABC transporter ATP-binding protein [Gemmatimonadaceae bacterium]|nr:ABC transporter ATP-binding protein [Gemmatimonadaceae bacterium]
MIEFRQLVVQYPRAKRPAVDGVSLEAMRGRITAVVGPNGSGKSTLVRTLVGRVRPRGGEVLIDGRSTVLTERRDVAKAVAVVAQSEEMAFPATVAEYISLGRFPHIGAWHRVGEADRRAMERATELAKVGDFLSRPMDALSGGERQRVRLARALAQGGEGLVLDEPTAFLDIGHEMTVFELLVALAREGQAVLLVSHNLNLIARFAGHIVLLDAGKVVAAGSPTDVMQPATLERVYGWPIAVTTDATTGTPTLIPLRAPS